MARHAATRVNAFRQTPSGKQPFEFKGTNGFMITFDIKSSDVKKKKPE